MRILLIDMVLSVIVFNCSFAGAYTILNLPYVNTNIAMKTLILMIISLILNFNTSLDFFSLSHCVFKKKKKKSSFLRLLFQTQLFSLPSLENLQLLVNRLLIDLFLLYLNFTRNKFFLLCFLLTVNKFEVLYKYQFYIYYSLSPLGTNMNLFI